MRAEEHEEWPVSGEVPSTDPNWLVEPSEKHFASRADNLAHKIPSDHGVATLVNNRLEWVSEHKKGVEVTAAALGVAGVLLAAHHLRRRKK